MNNLLKFTHTYHLGNYELPEIYHDFKIILTDEASKSCKLFNSNTVLLAQSSYFFTILLKNNFCEKFKGQVMFSTEVITEEAGIFILKWIHSSLLSKIKSLPKSGNVNTTKVKQKASVAELVAEKGDSVNFNLFDHFRASNYLMISRDYYEDLSSAFSTSLTTENGVNLLRQLLVVNEYFDNGGKLLKTTIEYTSQNLFELENFGSLITEFKKNGSLAHTLLKSLKELDFSDADKVNTIIRYLIDIHDVTSVLDLLNFARKLIPKAEETYENPPNGTFNLSLIDFSILLASEGNTMEFIKHNSAGETPLIWKIKGKLDKNKQIGIFFSPRAADQNGNVVNGQQSNFLFNTFGYFRTAVYNIRVQSSSHPVFKDQWSTYAFPLTENYFFGPSNVEDVFNAIYFGRGNNSDNYEIKIWLAESLFHSLLMHYIATHFGEIMLECEVDKLKQLELKEFISLLECSRLMAQVDPKKILHIINRYGIINKIEPDVQKTILSTPCQNLFSPQIKTDFITEASITNKNMSDSAYSIIHLPLFTSQSDSSP